MSSTSTASVLTRTLRMSHRQRRTFISSLFGFTFLAAVATVSAPALLPCPVNRSRYADASADPLDTEDVGRIRRRAAPLVVEKKPRRWIEETRPPRAPESPYPTSPSTSNAQS